jgi:hypothetical protein
MEFVTSPRKKIGIQALGSGAKLCCPQERITYPLKKYSYMLEIELSLFFF